MTTGHQKAPLRGPMPLINDQPMASHKLFNCIVDDTALIAGLKKSTRDGIKKWVNNGLIRLFVPLHTLERLRRLAQTDERISTDAKDALGWLDEITSLPEDAPNRHAVDLVHLQGGYETYDSWAEVEKFLLPETLLSMETEAPDTESVTDGLADLRIDAVPDNTSVSSHDSVDARTASPVSTYSATSPGLLNASPYKDSKVLQPIGTGRPRHKKTDSNVSSTSTESTVKKPKRTIPIALRPFFSYILWRIHQEENATAALESFLLVTNDPLKQQIAQRFGIRVKRLEQLREIIAREERDIKNREQMLKKQTEAVNHVQSPAKQSDDEDEIVLKRTPPKGPQAMNGRPVWDPNAFGRASHTPPRGGRGAFRSRAGSVRGNYPPRPVPAPAPRQAPVDLTKPIDPESFSRPPPINRVARGGKRRLWEPT